jgi:Ras-related protein Rab-32
MFFIHQVPVVGLQGAGKSSIIKRFVHNFFSEARKATIGVDFHLKHISLEDETKLRLQLWDGAEREQLSNRVFYKDAKGIFLVYDVTQPVEKVLKWKSYFDQFKLPNGNPLPVILLRNKSDLTEGKLEEEGTNLDEFCQQHGFICWFNTSAKYNTNIEEAVMFMAKTITIKNKPIEEETKPKIEENPMPPTTVEVEEELKPTKGSSKMESQSNLLLQAFLVAVVAGMATYYYYYKRL